MNEITSCNNKHMKIVALIFIGIVLALGNVFSGLFIANGLYRAKMGDKYVSVKGLAERKVKADVAIWDIGFKAAGNDLQQVSIKADSDRKAIVVFLIQHGIKNTEIESQQTSVVDLFANEYTSDNKPQNRYIISSGIRVNSPNVDLLKQVSSATSELIVQGVVLNKDYVYGANPRYLFTKLDSIRPAMLEEATKSARLVADQFAKNSDSNLGKIKHASQGLFQILSADSSPTQSSDADEAGSIYKKVRVVTSIDYFLEN